MDLFPPTRRMAGEDSALQVRELVEVQVPARMFQQAR